MAESHDQLVRGFAGQIRTLRRSLGLTQAELARRLRVHPTTVSEWERGIRVPQRRARRRISQMLSTIPSDSGKRDEPEAHAA